MTDDTDPVIAAADALRARGIVATPAGDDFERWQVGDLIYDDAGLMRLAERFAGEAAEP